MESVAWVAERKDVLSGLFFMLTLGAYVGYARRPFSLVRYLTVAVLFALGLMAKPMLVTLPFVLLLLDYWPLGRMGLPAATGRSFSFSRRLVVEKLPLLALTAASCVATPLAQGEAVSPVDAIPLSSRIANALVSYVAYIGNFFYPAGLAVFYPHPESGLPIWKVVAAALALAGISAAALAWRRRFPYLFVGWFWYLGMLVPVIGLVQVGSQAMADRYTYLPQIGLCLAVTWGVAQLAASWPHRRWVCGVASALVVLVLMGCAWRQTSYWRDSETLWTHTLACTARQLCRPQQPRRRPGRPRTGRRGHRPLSEGAGNQARLRRGPQQPRQRPGETADRSTRPSPITRRRWKSSPTTPKAHNNLGIALAGRGQVDAAIAHYQKALEIKPDYAEAHNNLGNALAGRGQVDAAIAHYRKALEIKPDYAEAHNNLGIALEARGQTDEAIAHYQSTGASLLRRYVS